MSLKGFLKKLLLGAAAITMFNNPAESSEIYANNGYRADKTNLKTIRSGYHVNIGNNLDTKLNKNFSLNLESRLESSFMRYHFCEGSFNSHEFDNNAMLKFNTNTSAKFVLALGFNINFQYDEDSFQHKKLSVSNKSIAPLIVIGVNSKYVDAGLTYMFGFGKHRDAIDGSMELMRHRANFKLDIKPFPSTKLSALARADYDIIDDNNFQQIVVRAGCSVAQDIIDNLALRASYEHRWYFNYVDGYNPDIFTIGILFKY